MVLMYVRHMLRTRLCGLTMNTLAAGGFTGFCKELAVGSSQWEVRSSHRAHGGHAVRYDGGVIGMRSLQQRGHGAHEGPPAQREHVAVQRGVEA